MVRASREVKLKLAGRYVIAETERKGGGRMVLGRRVDVNKIRRPPVKVVFGRKELTSIISSAQARIHRRRKSMGTKGEKQVKKVS